MHPCNLIHMERAAFVTMPASNTYISLVSTAKKHGMSCFEAVRAALTGNALHLVEQWG